MKWLCWFLLLASLGIVSCSGPASRSVTVLSRPLEADSGLVIDYLKANVQVLNFPVLVNSLYKENDHQYLWAAEEMQEQVQDALLMLDCVTQYGLTPEMYHPETLTAARLDQLDLESRKKARSKAETDVLLTDALLTFMFHLHYGRCNPRVSIPAVDSGQVTGLKIDSVFKRAMANPKQFRETILGVQPKSEAYRLLQDYQRLLTSQYAGDSFEIPNDTVRLISINLERYRWENADYNYYLEVNIPSFTLNYHNGTEHNQFRVIVGKPANATPLLKSSIKYFTTAPDWTVPASIFRKEILPKALADSGYLKRNNFTIYSSSGRPTGTDESDLLAIQQRPNNFFARQSAGCDNALGAIVFYFDNPFSVYLHDTPNRELFNKKNRALSHGCIRVENPEKLANLLLTADDAPEEIHSKVAGSMTAYRTYRYTLGKPVPVVIRYITCEIKDGIFVRHPDVYARDKALSAQFFREGARNKEQRTRNKEQGTRNKEQGTRNKY